MAKGWNKDGSYSVTLRDGGEFIAWTEKPPRSVEADGKPVAFRHLGLVVLKQEAASGRLSATLPAAGKQTVVLRW
jgi:hypothetical protein